MVSLDRPKRHKFSLKHQRVTPLSPTQDLYRTIELDLRDGTPCADTLCLTAIEPGARDVLPSDPNAQVVKQGK
jgi:hypothetical protein